MTDTRDPERKLLRDVVRYKRERNAARELPRGSAPTTSPPS